MWWLGARLAEPEGFLVNSPPEIVLQEHHVGRPVWIHFLPVGCDQQRVHAEHPLTGNRSSLETAVGFKITTQERELGLIGLPPLTRVNFLI